MTTPNDGGPAFPIVASTGDPRDGIYCRDGMSLRDYFAAKAMQGLLASNLPVSPSLDPCEVTAIAAFKMADAMLKEREKGEQ